MLEKLRKIREEQPDFDKKMVDMFAKNMPELLTVLIDGEKYDNHIGTKEVAHLAKDYITDSKGNYIGFHWSYDEVINAAKNYIDFDKVDFYPSDLWVWANVKYGDMSHITSDTMIILRYAISELTDPDFPYYPADKRAYYWLKKHVAENERE